MTARWSFPAASTALGLLLLEAPIGISGQAEIQASFALACVYFWSLYRPASLPPPIVFLIGLLVDLLSFAPVGVGVLTLLIAHGLAIRWRRVMVRQGFVLVWLAFVGVAIGAAALDWVFTAILTFRLLPPGPGLFLAALSSGLYPGIATCLTWAHQTLAEPERA